jgi:3-oxoacyl-[acyl-carrier-protein] synthase-3
VKSGAQLKKKAALTAIASYLPEQTLTNEELALMAPKWTAELIYQKTGIRTRYIAAREECASDLGVAAAQRLFASGVCEPRDVDFLLFCTQSPDYFLPATACVMQERLRLRTDTGALDFNQGCSGFVYGLSLAKGLIESRASRTVLLITAETYSKFIHENDMSTRPLFGDGACATLVTTVESEEELIGPFVFGTDGRGARNLIVKGGALRGRSMTEAEVDDRSKSLYMNGAEVFNFTLATIPPLVSNLIAGGRLERSDIDYFIFHQANRFMLEHLRQKLQIPTERFCINMDDYGNTVSSTIPMALELAMKRGDVLPGKRVMLVGFGVGYSWAGALIKTL